MATSHYTSKDRSRFWTKVVVSDENSCWEWQAKKIKSGYGHFKHAGKMRRAHRIAWEMTYGEIPDELWVLHECDNPSCVNPNHLFLGTPLDNTQDMIAKDRARYKGGKRKLSDIQIKSIQQKYALGNISQQELANEMNVSQMQISRIIRREV